MSNFSTVRQNCKSIIWRCFYVHIDISTRLALAINASGSRGNLPALATATTQAWALLALAFVGSAVCIQPPSALRSFSLKMVADPGEGGVAAEREEGAIARFETRKTQKMEAISCGSDKSKKGSFDAPIEDMLDHLNLHGEYVSTSSCSGRVAIFWENTATDTGVWTPANAAVAPGEAAPEGDTRRNKKGGLGGQWLLCRHGAVTAEDVLDALARAPKSPGIATFKHEPFILHVECRSLDAATRLMEVARNGGFRESGISIGKKHVMVGVRTSALKMEAPVLEDGQLLVDADYIKVLVRLANEKFVKNQERTDKLYALLRRALLANIPLPLDAPENGVPVPHFSATSNGHASGLEQTDATAARAVDAENMAVLCCTSECEQVRSMLVKADMLNKNFRNSKQADGRIAIPVTSQAASVLKAASTGIVDATSAHDGLLDNMRRGIVTVEKVENMQAAGKVGGKMSPYQRLVGALVLLLENVGGGGTRDAHNLKHAVENEGAVPHKWEEYTDMIVLPEGALRSQTWDTISRDKLWMTVAQSLGVTRVAVKGEIDTGRMRQSHVEIMHPSGADGWVKVAQNGLTYTFDVTKGTSLCCVLLFVQSARMLTC